MRSIKFRLWMTVGVLCCVASWAAMAGGSTDLSLGLAGTAKPSVESAESRTTVSPAAPHKAPHNALRSRAVSVGEAVTRLKRYRGMFPARW
jgi:hypothetical protein